MSVQKIVINRGPAGANGTDGADYPSGVTATSYTAGGTTTIDLSDASTLYYTTAATDGTLWAFTTPYASGSVRAFDLELTNGGSQTQTWPASVKWDGGAAPTLTAAGLDILTFYTRDGGTTWRGFLAAADSK